MASEDTDYVGTIRARAGGAWGRLFLYGTGGLAYGRVNYAAETDFRPFGTAHYPAAFSKTKIGWTVGFGAEYGINRHWSWKTEYLYYDLGKETVTADPASPLPPFQVMYTWTTTAHTFNTGFNYRW
jgi:outer membrane immunogenic protein